MTARRRRVRRGVAAGAAAAARPGARRRSGSAPTLAARRGGPGRAPAAGQPGPGASRTRGPAELDELVRGRAAQLRAVLVRGVPAAADGPGGSARRDGPPSPAASPFLAALRRRPGRGRRAAAQRQLGRRRCVAGGDAARGGAASRRSPRWRSGCAPSRSTGGSSPTGQSLGFEVVAGRGRCGRVPRAHPAAAGRRRGLPGRRPRPHRHRRRGRTCSASRPGCPAGPARLAALHRRRCCCRPARGFTPDGWTLPFGAIRCRWRAAGDAAADATQARRRRVRPC